MDDTQIIELFWSRNESAIQVCLARKKSSTSEVKKSSTPTSAACTA